MTQDNQNGERRRTERLRANAGAIVMATILVFSVFAGVGVVATQPTTDQQSGTAESKSVQTNEWVYTASADGVVKRVSAADGTEDWNASFGTQFQTVALSPDGSTVYVGANDGSGGGVWALNAKNGSVIWKKQPSVSYDLEVSPDGNRLYSATYADRSIRVFDTSDGTVTNTITNVDGHATSIVPHPTKDLIILGTGDGGADDAGGRVTAYYPNGTIKWQKNEFIYYALVGSLSITDDGSTVFAGANADGGGSTHNLVSLNTTDGSQNWGVNNNGAVVEDVSLSESEDSIAVGWGNGDVTTHSTSDGTQNWAVSVFSWTASVGYSADGSTVYAGGRFGSVAAIDTSTQSTNWNVSHHSDWVYGLTAKSAFESDGGGSGGGGSAGSENLTIDTRSLFKPNSTHPYSVTYTNDTGNTTERTDVTSNASVNTSDTSILSVNTTSATLTSVNDSTVNATVNVTANYTTSDGTELTTSKEVVVASVTVENLELLPNGTWRTSAVIGDSFMQALLVALFIGVAMTRFTSAFGGLAGAQMVLTIGWFAGYVSWAMAAVSLFVALFIGLNLAANIDYTVRR